MKLVRHPEGHIELLATRHSNLSFQQCVNISIVWINYASLEKLLIF